MRMVLGLSSYFVYHFFLFFDLVFFPGVVSIRIDTLWAKLLLEFSSDHFETMHVL